MALRAQGRKPSRKLNQGELWDFALRSLGQREHSVSELRQKLCRRAESVSDVNATVARLVESGLIDDRRFAEMYASTRLAEQGFGRQRVVHDLRGKQVPESLAKEAVARAYSDTDEASLIEAFLARKYRGKDLRAFLSEQKNLASAYRRLRLAGFGTSAILAALKRHSAAAEDLPEPEDDSADAL
ncbi:MAG TPA: regulatory protein RecX [Bryobacteraceae bacterium]|jgi:regulatory protein|nr:regulatory protein RecX [Bryobacteraceae bacterium]